MIEGTDTDNNALYLANYMGWSYGFWKAIIWIVFDDSLRKFWINIIRRFTRHVVIYFGSSATEDSNPSISTSTSRDMGPHFSTDSQISATDIDIDIDEYDDVPDDSNSTKPSDVGMELGGPNSRPKSVTIDVDSRMSWAKNSMNPLNNNHRPSSSEH